MTPLRTRAFQLPRQVSTGASSPSEASSATALIRAVVSPRARWRAPCAASPSTLAFQPVTHSRPDFDVPRTSGYRQSAVINERLTHSWRGPFLPLNVAPATMPRHHHAALGVAPTLACARGSAVAGGAGRVDLGCPRAPRK